MKDRRPWTEQEDAILKHIVLEMKVTKWTQVAAMMQQTSKEGFRTPKQCRERWIYALDPNISNKDWTAEEELIMYNLHNIYGNKWTKISQAISGRTDSCVKNHFYSKMRKTIRTLNKELNLNKHKLKKKPISANLLSKILITAEMKFEDRDERYSAELIQKCVGLKNNLFNYEKQSENITFQSMIETINDVSKQLDKKKRRTKQSNESQSDDTSQLFHVIYIQAEVEEFGEQNREQCQNIFEQDNTVFKTSLQEEIEEIQKQVTVEYASTNFTGRNICISQDYDIEQLAVIKQFQAEKNQIDFMEELQDRDFMTEYYI